MDSASGIGVAVLEDPVRIRARPRITEEAKVSGETATDAGVAGSE